MNEHDHFTRFRNAHRRMQVERTVEKPHTPSNGHDASETMQGMEHLPDKLPFLVWLREYFKKGWLLVAPIRQEGKYSISQPLALVIIAASLAAFWAYSSTKESQTKADREEIIILRTQLKMEQEKNVDQDSKIDQARATAQIADRNSARLEGKFDQFALQFATGNLKKNPIPIQE